MLILYICLSLYIMRTNYSHHTGIDAAPAALLRKLSLPLTRSEHRSLFALHRGRGTVPVRFSGSAIDERRLRWRVQSLCRHAVRIDTRALLRE